MFHPTRTFLLLASALALGACATNDTIPRFAGQPPAEPHRIGSVALVNNVRGFVLIDSRETPAAGVSLNTLPAKGEKAALLKVSREKQDPFIIADIVNGAPRVGDRVVLAPQ